MSINSNKIAKVKTAMDNRYENKQANKKTSITGSYTNDNDSYPTVLACLNKFGELITSWSVEPSDTKYPSEKLIKNELDTKITKSQTVGLVKNDGTIDTTTYLSEHQSLDSKTITIEQQVTADSGYAATYVLKQGGVALSPKINIAKDKLLQSASLETVGSSPSTLESSYNLVAGDKYIKLVVNTENSETGATTLVIPVSDLVDVYDADNTTLSISNGVFSIKNSGVDTNQIKDDAVTSDKIADSVVNSWLTLSDVDGEINQALDDLAELINPTSP